MVIRRATPADAALLAEHRAAVWIDVGDWTAAELAAQIPIWASFFRARLQEATYVAFIAEDDGTTIGSGAILLHLTIPRPGSPSDRTARVQSIYVLPDARRRGVGRAIMQHLITYAREQSLVSLTLRPSDAARPLYATLGFEAVDEMRLLFIEP